jgi:hypothetical protein
VVQNGRYVRMRFWLWFKINPSRGSNQ